MGSIRTMLKKESWLILDTGTLKSNGKLVYDVAVGTVDYDYEGTGYLTVLMTEEVYNKIIKGEYSFLPQVFSDPPILIKDERGNIIDPLV